MSELDTSSVTSFEDISVCNEIDKLIEKCENLNNHIHTSYETLQNIQSLFQNNFIVTYNEWTGDFDELLNNIHNKCLKTIKETGDCNFGDMLIDIINNSIFN
jgi:hypothetical protein